MFFQAGIAIGIRSVQLLLAGTCILAVVRAESSWAYVPASRNARVLGMIELPYVPDEDVICVLRPDAQTALRTSEPRMVFAVEVGDPKPEHLHSPPVALPDMGRAPDGSRWPDENNVIVVPPEGDAGVASVHGIRNPWEVRARVDTSEEDAVFQCGGIIIGGEGGPVAFVNGRTVKKGDPVGKFSVARILEIGVILERGGSYYVLRSGRRTTIRNIRG